ncbi:MAG TPA: DUF1345 domain-containing protein [Acidimicrobiales bacterium]|jgi:uncharacterized membrane protein|nr:DUF1345 domain-containing protein [Acidimicrobiales bacterium]
MRRPTKMIDYLEGVSASTRVALAAILGVVVGIVAAFFTVAQAAALIGWDVAAAAFLVGVWLAIGYLDPEGTHRRSIRLDPSRGLADVLVITAGVAILTAVALALARAGGAHGGTKAYLLAVGLVSVVFSWLSVHTIFTLKYARLYYGDEVGGIEFNERDGPDYVDFAYLAFTIGMTFQVSDTNLTAKPIRRTALRHALISYLFGAVIIAVVINIVASLL